MRGGRDCSPRAGSPAHCDHAARTATARRGGRGAVAADQSEARRFDAEFLNVFYMFLYVFISVCEEILRRFK